MYLGNVHIKAKGHGDLMCYLARFRSNKECLIVANYLNNLSHQPLPYCSNLPPPDFYHPKIPFFSFFSSFFFHYMFSNTFWVHTLIMLLSLYFPLTTFKNCSNQMFSCPYAITKSCLPNQSGKLIFEELKQDNYCPSELSLKPNTSPNVSFTQKLGLYLSDWFQE